MASVSHTDSTGKRHAAGLHTSSRCSLQCCCLWIRYPSTSRDAELRISNELHIYEAFGGGLVAVVCCTMASATAIYHAACPHLAPLDIGIARAVLGRYISN